jgi:ubiquinone/menaquinone biosynthesis C-methylase UbiE
MARDYYKRINDFHKKAALEQDGFYDSRGSRLKHHPVQLWTRKQILTLLVPVVSGRETLLDVGCGRGDLAIFLKDYFPHLHIIGLDIVPEMADLAKRVTNHLMDVKFNVGDIKNLPYDNYSFDITIANNVLHHLLPQDQPSAITELTRVSKKYLILELKNGKSLYHKVKKKKIAHLDLYPTNLSEIKGLLQKNHFVVEKKKYFFFVEFLSPWLVLRAKKIHY